jgi:hypothetical protein
VLANRCVTKFNAVPYVQGKNFINLLDLFVCIEITLRYIFIKVMYKIHIVLGDIAPLRVISTTYFFSVFINYAKVMRSEELMCVLKYI